MVDYLYDDPLIPRRRQRSARKVLPVTIEQVRTGGWSGNNQLGNEQDFGPDANNRQTILKLDEWGPPDVWTVALGMYWADQSYSPTDAFDVIADISFGVGGATQRVEVSWLNGTILSLPMNAVNIVAQYQFVYASPTPPDRLRLSVLLSRGGRSNGFPATRCIAASVLAATASPIILIPPFTSKVHLVAQDSGSDGLLFAATTSLRFYTASGAASQVGYVGGDRLPYYPDGVPLPAGAHYMNLDNAGGSLLKVSYICKLCV